VFSFPSALSVDYSLSMIRGVDELVDGIFTVNFISY
jgi:hypothetical protein